MTKKRGRDCVVILVKKYNRVYFIKFFYLYIQINFNNYLP